MKIGSRCFVFFALAVFSSSSLVWAQATSNSAGRMEMVVPQQAKKTFYNFEEVDILGNLKRPEGQTVVSQPEFQFRTLLDLDESFIPNILNSVDEY